MAEPGSELAGDDRRDGVQRLLVVSCSRTKRHSAEPMPALERYDGPLFRVLRKFLRECPLARKRLDIYVLSAKLGLCQAGAVVPDYDLRMGRRAAEAWRPQVLETLGCALSRGRYGELFITVGGAYRLALSGYEELVPAGTKVTWSSGSIGRRQGELHDWLRGEQPALAPGGCGAKVTQRVQIRGVKIGLSGEEVLRVAQRALAEGRGNPSSYQLWFVELGGERVAPKWLVSQISGLPVSGFTSTEARRVLGQLGIEVSHV